MDFLLHKEYMKKIETDKFFFRDEKIKNSAEWPVSHIFQ